ncbi:tryptophan synthase beta subunit-like PLP-dependent enzyme [Wallemia mellicola]|uniref:Tryptophan synthase beta subunit-like PLP-dependent enzyme n=1 Tax=Wallemia mellicola TaxID=1708541 RepID=A0A4T0NT78_9BASI|nr:tryptophan synthase beta subunit-like PLP-dependent enzyme [Wallemia mellicola]
MSVDKENNVYSGQDAIYNYLHPDKTPPTPLVELPNHQFSNDKVRIWAKLHSAHPLSNVKAFPAFNMLEKAKSTNMIKDGLTKEIVEYSSGSTIMSLGVIARQMGINSTIANLSNKTSNSKIDLLRFFGLELTFFPGPSQPLSEDVDGGIYHAANRGKQEYSYNPDQYANDENPNAHVRWTAPQILKQKPDINIFCAGMGTSGTMTGTGNALKASKPDIINVGVCTSAGDRVPGPRALSMLKPVTWYDWRSAIDTVEEVGSKDSYELSLWLSRNGLLAGPSSGFNLKGLYNYLERAKNNNDLDKLRSEDGFVNCVFICCDLPYVYINEYKEKLGESFFAPMHNSELLGVDKYPYLDAWELHPDEAIVLAKEDLTRVLDLRSSNMFNQFRIPSSLNIPVLEDIYPNCAPNPFLNASEMARQWPILDEKLRQVAQEYEGKKILVVCEHGGSSRSANSILRKFGVESYTIRGGINRWIDEGKSIERTIGSLENSHSSSSSQLTTKSALVVEQKEQENVPKRKLSSSKRFSQFIRKARQSIARS